MPKVSDDNPHNFETFLKTKAQKVVMYKSTPKELSKIPIKLPPISVKKKRPHPINSRLKSKMAKELLRFQPEGTKVLIRPEGKYKKRKYYYQKVAVTYLRPDKPNSGFRALIDPQTGKVIKTWDRTIFENFARQSIKLTPDGEL